MIRDGNREHGGSSSEHIQGRRLILLVTDDSPRSKRARANLANMLERVSADHVAREEIDLIAHPDAAVRYRVFATPALIWERAGKVQRVLYGDLSEHEALEAFLAD